ncbi:MAG TPA: hypothetical protein VGB73_17195 [Pyrinomonadaceae bacterium]|jgi:hypothetical protein
MNQLGYRGQKIEYAEGDFVVVLVGDSQVEAMACAYGWMPERRLEHYLAETSGRPVKVFTVGAGGYGQDQQLLALREYYRRFSADLVVLWETPINDIYDNVFPSSWSAFGDPKPTFWLEQGELRGPTEEIGQPVRETPRFKLQLLVRRSRPWARDRDWEQRYPPAYKPLTAYEGEALDDWQRQWNDNVRDARHGNLENEKTPYAMFLTPRSERTRYGLDLTRKLVGEISRLAASHGGRFAAFATMLPPPTYDDWKFDGVHLLNGKYYVASERQFYENVSYINDGFNFHLIPITVEPWAVGPEDYHLNEHAADQVIKDFAGRIDALIEAR